MTCCSSSGYNPHVKPACLVHDRTTDNQSTSLSLIHSKVSLSILLPQPFSSTLASHVRLASSDVLSAECRQPHYVRPITYLDRRRSDLSLCKREWVASRDLPVRGKATAEGSTLHGTLKVIINRLCGPCLAQALSKSERPHLLTPHANIRIPPACYRPGDSRP